jgi:hypothetical protein
VEETAAHETEEIDKIVAACQALDSHSSETTLGKTKGVPDFAYMALHQSH